MDKLTPEEQAYFESGGATLPGADKGPAEPVETVQPVEQARPAELAPEPALAPTEPEDGQGEPAPAKQDFVPQQALHKERERRKAAETAAREREIELARLQERLRLFEKPPETEKALPPPDPDEDVFAAVKHDRTQLQSIQEKLAELERQGETRAQMASLESMTRVAEQRFREATPDYDDAVSHLKTSRVNELMLWGLPTDQAQMQVQQEAAEIVSHAIRNRKSPAEVAYEMARLRGYQPRSVAQQSPVSDEKKERAQQASKSLSGTGASPAGTMTAERLLKMSNSEFLEYSAKNPSIVEKLMGA